MNSTQDFLLSNLLSNSVRCNKGLDHGIGISCWMHPPVHRLLGWATRPSVLKLSRDVWRLNQIKGINKNIVYVKGNPESSDQTTLDRLPSLIDAQLLNIDNLRLGLIADLVFKPKTGEIQYYLVSRSDPRIPGTSRWKLSIDKIKDQQPGIVLTDLRTLDDLPLVKSSIRQNLFKKSKLFRDQFQEFSDQASVRLEGWLEESSSEVDKEDYQEFDSSYNDISSEIKHDDWIDEEYPLKYKDSRGYRDSSNLENTIEGEDPWV